MKMYVVYRHGWNASNQSPERGLPEKMPVARVEADSPEEARKKVEDDDGTLDQTDFMASGWAVESVEEVNDA